jgi:predicted protein tyrosine phosphatase
LRRFRATICGIEELDGHRGAGVTHVLSLLDPGWPPPPFDGYDSPRRLDLRFHDIVDPLPGLRRPGPEDVASLLRFGAGLGADAAFHLLVHCQKGLSRSTASLALILAQAEPARPAADLFAEVVQARPLAWPNLRLIEVGDALLGRDGTLVAAAAACYRARIAERPQLADAMIEMGRARELDCAARH